MRRILPPLALLLLVLGLVLAGCGESDEELGVVARVNGQPIRLGRLQARYDLLYLDFSESAAPTVDKLRVEYGRLLAGLIVQELAAQELERRGLAVTDKDIAEAEKKIRADYPPGAFEQVLADEYIDLKAWREQLGVRLGMEKFFAEVLRPKVKLDYQEVMAYFKDHPGDFAHPARVRLITVQAGNETLVKQALAAIRRDHAAKPESHAAPGVEIKELRLKQDNLPTDWRAALKGLSPGEATPPLAAKDGWIGLIFVESVPGENLNPAQAYPLAEQALLERKLHEAFEEWLAQALRTASIKVNAALREKVRQEGVDVPPATANETAANP